MNMESLKIRINELYRDMKSRNQVAKWMLQKYYEGAVGREEREKDERRYKEERKDKQDQPQDLQQVCVKDKGKDKEDGLDKLLHPFKVSLVV